MHLFSKLRKYELGFKNRGKIKAIGGRHFLTSFNYNLLKKLGNGFPLLTNFVNLVCGKKFGKSLGLFDVGNSRDKYEFSSEILMC